MPNFIYVFDDGARDKLLGMKFELLKRDDLNHVYVFVNEDNGNFAMNDVEFVLSDTLTF